MTPSESASKAAKRKSASKEASKAAASASSKALGDTATYGLPKGPSWLKVYSNGKDTDVHLDPNKVNTVKLQEYASFQLGGTLPWLGIVKSNEWQVGPNSREATLDEESSFKRGIAPAGANFNTGDTIGSLDFNDLKKADHKAISKQVFTDLPMLLDAISTNDKSKLPNQSSELLDSFRGQNSNNEIRTKYQLEEMYYNKEGADTTQNGKSNQMYLRVKKDGTNDIDKTTLGITIFAKVKTTDVNPDMPRVNGLTPSYGETQTEIDAFDLEYTLVDDNKWQLTHVDSSTQSHTALDTSQGSWIVQKVAS
jgi:hypothetical protein